MIVKAGNLFPDVETVVKDQNGTPIDVTGSTVKFSMHNARSPATKPIDHVAGATGNSTTTAANGGIKYAWNSGDTGTPGTYEGIFHVTPLVGDPYDVPTDGVIEIVIEESW